MKLYRLLIALVTVSAGTAAILFSASGLAGQKQIRAEARALDGVPDIMASLCSSRSASKK